MTSESRCNSFTDGSSLTDSAGGGKGIFTMLPPAADVSVSLQHFQTLLRSSSRPTSGHNLRAQTGCPALPSVGKLSVSTVDAAHSITAPPRPPDAAAGNGATASGNGATPFPNVAEIILLNPARSGHAACVYAPPTAVHRGTGWRASRILPLLLIHKQRIWASQVLHLMLSTIALLIFKKKTLISITLTQTRRIMQWKFWPRGSSSYKETPRHTYLMRLFYTD